MARFIQCPKTRKLIPAEEYSRHQDMLGSSAYVQEDIKPFVSPIDQRVIKTRADLRAHNSQHGVTDMRDYGSDWFERKAKERAADYRGESRKADREATEDIKRAMQQYGIEV